MNAPLSAPFPWFSGKSRVAPIVWERFGKVDNYVEPFFGSGAVLLARPDPTGVETVNDLDGMVANFWRAVKHAPDEVAEWADWPVNETDLAARHYWLVTKGRNRLAALLGDPDGYDAQVAGWWLWGICSWIGSGWCSGNGPWQWSGDEWIKNDAGRGINRQLPHMSAGRGINRQRPHMSDAGQGINRKLPHMSAGQGIREWMDLLAARLRRVRVAHGDWTRVTGDSVTWRHGRTAVFLDPPYQQDLRADVYAVETPVSADVRAWAIEAGKRPDMLICLAGYDNEHDMPADWAAVNWKAKGGYGLQGNDRGRENAGREMLWFSPACIGAKQEALL